MNAYLLAGLIAAGFCGTIGAFFFGRAEGREIEREHQQQTALLIQQVKTEMLASASQAIGKIEMRQQTVRQEVQTLVREVPVYRDAHCVNTPDGLRLINAALTGAAESPDPGQLPGADTAHGPVIRGDGAEAGGSGGAVPKVSPSGPRD